MPKDKVKNPLWIYLIIAWLIFVFFIKIFYRIGYLFPGVPVASYVISLASIILLYIAVKSLWRLQRKELVSVYLLLGIGMYFDYTFLSSGWLIAIDILISIFVMIWLYSKRNLFAEAKSKSR